MKIGSCFFEFESDKLTGEVKIVSTVKPLKTQVSPSPCYLSINKVYEHGPYPVSTNSEINKIIAKELPAQSKLGWRECKINSNERSLVTVKFLKAVGFGLTKEEWDELHNRDWSGWGKENEVSKI